MARITSAFSVEQQRTKDLRITQNCTPEQRALCEQIDRIFGWRARSVKIVWGNGKEGACCVEVVADFGGTFEFMFANGLLIEIPPKKHWWV
jgi:hypothetical protein